MTQPHADAKIASKRVALVCTCGDWDWLHGPDGCRVCNILSECEIDRPCPMFLPHHFAEVQPRMYRSKNRRAPLRGHRPYQVDAKRFAATFAKAFGVDYCPEGLTASASRDDVIWPI